MEDRSLAHCEHMFASTGRCDKLDFTPPKVTHRWAGIFGLTQDLLPLVGRVPGRGGVWVSAGYSGHGNVLGLMCGELVSASILGGDDPLLELFAPSRLLELDPS